MMVPMVTIPFRWRAAKPCAMVQPDRKIASVQVKSVRKKLKKKDFAAKVSREEIAEGAADLGLEQDELIAHVLGRWRR